MSRKVDGCVWLKMFRGLCVDGLFCLFMSTFTFRDVFVKLRSVLNMPGVFEVVDDLRSLYVMQM